MPVRASALLNRTTTITTPEGDITVTYRRPTVKDYDAIAAAAKAVPEGEEQTTEEIIRAQLIPLLTGWDLLGDDDKPLPLTAENILSFLPGEEATALLRTVLKSEKGNDPEVSTEPSSISS